MADAIDRTWPIPIAALRKALKYEADQGDPEELLLYTTAACERIDRRTGRDKDPNRHLVDGVLPVTLILAARTTAKLWWQQHHNGPGGGPTSPEAQAGGPPMGADLPRQVEGWLSEFPAPPGFGQAPAEPES